MPAAAWTRQVECDDAHDRPKRCTVAVRDGRAVLTVPAGETAKYSSGQLSSLIETLERARIELWRREP